MTLRELIIHAPFPHIGGGVGAVSDVHTALVWLFKRHFVFSLGHTAGLPGKKKIRGSGNLFVIHAEEQDVNVNMGTVIAVGHFQGPNRTHKSDILRPVSPKRPVLHQSVRFEQLVAPKASVTPGVVWNRERKQENFPSHGEPSLQACSQFLSPSFRNFGRADGAHPD